MTSIRTTVGGRAIGAAVLALLAATCWWARMGWHSVPYEPWQVVGAVLTLAGDARCSSVARPPS